MNLPEILLTLGTSLLLTLAVELSFAVLLGVRGSSALLLVALVNLATNPLVVYTYIVVRMFVGRGQADGIMPFLEIGAVFLEAWLYANTSGMMDPEKLFYGAFSTDRNGNHRDNRCPAIQGVIRGKKRQAFRRVEAALLLSFLLNAASFLAGTLVNSL